MTKSLLLLTLAGTVTCKMYEVEWGLNMEQRVKDYTIKVNEGDIVRFSWTHVPHDVFEVSSKEELDACALSSMKRLSKTGTYLQHNVTMNGVETRFFTCSVAFGLHCRFGQKLVVEVNAVPLPPAPPPPRRSPPPPSRLPLPPAKSCSLCDKKQSECSLCDKRKSKCSLCDKRKSKCSLCGKRESKCSLCGKRESKCSLCDKKKSVRP